MQRGLASTPHDGNRPLKEALDDLAILLPQDAAMLVRLIFNQVDSEVSRPVAGLLKSLSDGPLRITELARVEGLAQPTATALVIQAEKRGWVRRERDTEDKRVVIVSITTRGKAARRQLHASIRKIMKECTQTMAHDDVVAAGDAIAPLQALIAALRGG